MITNLQFAQPLYLWLLLAIPLYLVGIFMYTGLQGGFVVSTFEDLQKAQKKTWRRWIPLLRSLLVVLLIAVGSIALARPQHTNTVSDITKKGIDIVVALDVSDSMRAEDIAPNRIEAAKQALNQFIDKRNDDRVGIVIFAGVPFTQSPLTFDYSVLRFFVDSISTKSIQQNVYGASGTAIGDAILSGVRRLTADKKDTKRQKVLVLISDGDANVGIDPLIAAKKAHDEGVIIYTVGVGKKGGAPVPVTDALGNTVYARNADGSIYKATFDETTMKKIASLTGGRFFRVDDTTAFTTALTEIDALQKRDVSVATKVTYSDSFAVWLWVTAGVFVLFLLLEVLVRLKK